MPELPADAVADLHAAILNAIPDPVLVVDPEVRIVSYNQAASTLLGENPSLILRRRGGDVLHCIHAAETPEGCGAAPDCRDCVIRNAVKRASGGAGVKRRAYRMQRVRDAQIGEAHILVTTAPIELNGNRLVLLVLEDISELVALRGVLPICSACRKVRDDEKYWNTVEEYFKRQLDIDFSHGICPDCAARLYPDLVRSNQKL